MPIRIKKIRCQTCPVMHAWEEGRKEFFFQNCTTESCELHAFEALEHVSFWRWCLEVFAWQSHSLDVSAMVMAWPMTHIRAYVVFKAHLAHCEAEAQREAEEEKMKKGKG